MYTWLVPLRRMEKVLGLSDGELQSYRVPFSTMRPFSQMEVRRINTFQVLSGDAEEEALNVQRTLFES